MTTSPLYKFSTKNSLFSIMLTKNISKPIKQHKSIRNYKIANLPAPNSLQTAKLSQLMPPSYLKCLTWKGK